MLTILIYLFVSVPTYYTNGSSGNRIIPIGSKKLHCDPPIDFRQLSVHSEGMYKVLRLKKNFF